MNLTLLEQLKLPLKQFQINILIKDFERLNK